MPYPAAMAARNETKDPAADRWRSPARARMVQSAATLIREHGIHGTGLREVVAHSGGPRGSLGRFFPGGKTQLVTEAIDVALVDLFGDLERTLSEAETFPEAISVIVAPWRRLLVDYDFALGCPLAATICGRGRQRQPPHPCPRRVRRVASASRRRLRQVWGVAGGSRSARDGAHGCARRCPHTRSRSTKHRAARHSRALFRATRSRPRRA
jgi:AcrR family transcriptional regulator